MLNSTDNYAIVLAGGVGKRMGDVNLPKQFLEICQIPIIILTIQNIIKTKLFKTLYIAIHPDWKEYLQQLLYNYELRKNIKIIDGGKDRNDSIENALDALKRDDIKDDDIVVIHDAVRPFISKELLQNAVIKTAQFGATVAIVPAKDTMIVSHNGIASSIPNRNEIFHGQAPDSFKFCIIYNALKSLTSEEKKSITGTAQICSKKNIAIHTFLGDERNIKITTITDLFLAKAIFKELYEQ